MTGLGDLDGGAFNSFALGVSGDGSVIAGSGTSAAGSESFRWTATGGMVSIDDLPGGDVFGSAHEVSADGSVISGSIDSRWSFTG